jgi:hypothetical protein
MGLGALIRPHQTERTQVAPLVASVRTVCLRENFIGYVVETVDVQHVFAPVRPLGITHTTCVYHMAHNDFTLHPEGLTVIPRIGVVDHHGADEDENSNQVSHKSHTVLPLGDLRDFLREGGSGLGTVESAHEINPSVFSHRTEKHSGSSLNPQTHALGSLTLN